MSEKKRPWRYKLYDRIPISLRTMDYVIYGLVAAIVVAIVVGLAIR